ncbi:lipopolysaccharide assembly protein LapA domain-containing protein [Calorimonas adulescens]|uniref:DUF1049 domain-containing protein n=1 Tax=Calorimonas adulescens TaxID=2606906 RepID=A0A5D8QGH5_9THEO|nr:lipopolysaccharide assembly protein LapA domain-containing protein [Calorimonas adulescens]TZE83507.1 DUF1049 domain-containing protein [Calorimonas adulescens]
MKGQYYIILVLIFAILVSIFAISNAAPVDINFLYWHYTISQALVILLSAATGAVAIGIVGVFGQVSHGIKVRGLNNRIKNLEKENEELRVQLQGLQREIEAATGRDTHVSKDEDESNNQTYGKEHPNES